MKQIIFESAPEYIVVCAAIGLLYAAGQYWRNRHQPWTKTIQWTLFSIRALVTFFLALLLMGPIVKQINNIFDKPLFVVLQDNSQSIAQVTDSATRQEIGTQLRGTISALNDRGYNAALYNLSGEESEQPQFNADASDLHGALKRITSRFEGSNIAGVVLASDGIYNAGLSPLYGNYNFPIYTVGMGDTTQRTDIGIRNVSYNKIAYQGNKFPVRAEVLIRNFAGQQVDIMLSRKGKAIERRTARITGNDFLTIDFQVVAEEQGIQKLDIELKPVDGEQNIRNNKASIFVEVVEGKKKILLVAPAPHPDIKALREVVARNANYELLVHIPGVSNLQPAQLKPEQIDLAIFHQSPDNRSRTNSLFQTFSASKSSLLLILGQQSDIGQLSRFNMPLKFEGIPRDFDEVTPVVNAQFSSFALSAEATSTISDFPPAYVHFGKMQLALSAVPLLFQRIGSVSTQKPLLAVDVKDNRKIGIMLGEGLWRWRLNEFDRTEGTAGFDELFGKLIQFLSTTDEKRKFRSYPVQQEFADTEPVVFESQVYNDIFEPVFGNTIDISITNEQGKKSDYRYVTSPGNNRYQIGDLKEGVYRYRSRTNINNKTEEVRGEFVVVERQAELQNLTADFDLLRKLAQNSGGKFYTTASINALKQDLERTEAKSIIRSEESFDSLINLKWVFWLLLVLISIEWGLRKYFGSY